jgi:glycosyltransferase involved in cell wall biosynthesis
VKVVHIITGLGQGGAESILFNLLNKTNSRVKNYVISLKTDHYYNQKITELGIPVYVLNINSLKSGVVGFLKLISLLKTIKPEIVQTWMYHGDAIGGLAAKIAQCPSIFWGIHNTNLDKNRVSKTSILSAKFCAIFSRWIPDYIISCSNSSAQFHINEGYCAKKMKIIFNGYDVNKFYPDAELKEKKRKEIFQDTPPNCPILGMVARWDPLKDHDNLFEAIRIASQKSTFIFLLIGQGMDKTNPALLDRIAYYTIEKNMMLLGPKDNIPAIMNVLDIHVLSSFSEAFPNVLSEAMACGIPCITTDVGDASTIVGNTGWIVGRANPSALAEKILTALNTLNTKEHLQRQQECRDRIKSLFSDDQMADHYITVWQNR